MHLTHLPKWALATPSRMIAVTMGVVSADLVIILFHLHLTLFGSIGIKSYFLYAFIVATGSACIVAELSGNYSLISGTSAVMFYAMLGQVIATLINVDAKTISTSLFLLGISTIYATRSVQVRTEAEARAANTPS